MFTSIYALIEKHINRFYDKLTNIKLLEEKRLYFDNSYS